MLLREQQRFNRRARLQDLITMPQQRGERELAVYFIRFHQQNRFLAFG